MKTSTTVKSPRPIALAEQLLMTSQVISQVKNGQPLDKVLPDVPLALRPGVQALSYHVLRHWGMAQVLMQKLVQKAPPAEVEFLLCVALALCATQKNEGAESESLQSHSSPRYRPYVLVNEAVNAAKLHSQTRSFVPLINGVLRSFLREKDQLLAQSVEQSSLARWNFPAWWVGRLQADWPHDWQNILRSAQIAAPMTLRVNAKWATPQEAVAYLERQGIAAKVTGPYAVELQVAMGVDDIPGFDQGYFSVQAAEAQLAAPLLLDAQWLAKRHAELGRPLRVLDACAAPGGKTAHMLEIAPQGSIEVLALDSDGSRLDKVEDTLLRIQQKAQLCEADAGDVQDWCGADEYFDAILLDAPCTASGIVRRHPDIRWLRRKSDVQELAAQQRRLLQALWTRLSPQGRLLYCTCSVFKAEGEENAQDFDMRHNGVQGGSYKRLPAPGHMLPVRTDGAQECATPVVTDGFYYALFEK